MKIDGQSETTPIKSILLKHPRDAFESQQSVASQWEGLGYTGLPDFERALLEYDNFVGLLSQNVSDIHFLPKSSQTGLDSMYVHDPVIITRSGAILCGMGKSQRRGEPDACGRFLAEIGVPVLGRITGEGLLEGGDVVWIDQRTVAIGEGYRTNAEGIRQFKNLVGGLVDEVIPVALPHWEGPSDVLHLMSMISPVDSDLALVYSRLMPVPFRQWLIDRGIKLLEVPDEEYPTMGCNVLAVEPRKCIMLGGNPQTKCMLENEGVIVFEYAGEEISKKGAGGPTCLTRPLLREG